MNDLSMVGNDTVVASLAITDLYTLHCKPCLKEYARVNEVYLGTGTTPPYVIIGKDGLNTLDGIKGAKLRSAGALWDRFADAVGASGVNVPSSDMYDGLSRGIIDTTIYAVGGLKTHSLADVAKVVVMMPLGSFRTDNLFAFNMDRWAELTPDQRTAVLHATAIGVVATDFAYLEGDKEGLEVARKQNIPLKKPGRDLLKLRNAFIKKDVSNAVERAKKNYHIEDPKSFIDTYCELYAKYDDLIKPFHEDQQKIVNVLWKEVFSKVDVNSYGMKR